jgi:hypothetical protein
MCLGLWTKRSWQHHRQCRQSFLSRSGEALDHRPFGERDGCYLEQVADVTFGASPEMALCRTWSRRRVIHKEVLQVQSQDDLHAECKTRAPEIHRIVRRQMEDTKDCVWGRRYRLARVRLYFVNLGFTDVCFQGPLGAC